MVFHHHASRIQRRPTTSLQSPTPGQAYHMEPMKCVKHPHHQTITETTYHMPSPINRHKRKRTTIPHRPDLLTINVPRPQLLFYKPILSTPLQGQRPALVANPVTDPVVLADVNERFHTTVQQGGDVVLSGMELIHCIEECCIDVITAGRKVVVGERGVDT
jgi:hypothetical protein